MPLIQLKPIDTLFFRDGKPFTMGEDTFVSSAIMPYPSVFWGALYTSLLYSGKVDASSDIDKLKIKAVYLFKEDNKDILLPTPMDLLLNKQDKVVFTDMGKYELVENPYFKGEKTNLKDIEGVLKVDEKVEQPVNTFILLSAFIASYSNMRLLGSIDIRKDNSFVKSNSKIGIGRDKDLRTADDGKLYRINMQEYEKEWSFLIDCDLDTTIEMPPKGIVRLGGEGKMASFKVLTDEPDSITELNDSQAKIKQELKDKELFKVVFSTPFVYNGRELITELFNAEGVVLLSALMDKPISIGGFDMAAKNGKGMPKPMLKGLPAGCVFICCKEKGVEINAFEQHLNKKLNDYSKKGFNNFYLTHYKE
jgi:CRISPR-associated protein Cmr3